jgi:hypothetical protein
VDLSCEIHATASTFAGWSRKSRLPSSAAARGSPERSSSGRKSADARAWNESEMAWCQKVLAPKSCHTVACSRSCTGE